MNDALTLPHMVDVKSTNVQKVGHDDKTNMLHVIFKGGVHYSYADVPVAKYHALLAADSVGAYVHGHIKGQHKHRKH